MTMKPSTNKTNPEYLECIPEERTWDKSGDPLYDHIRGILAGYAYVVDQRKGHIDLITLRQVTREIKELVQQCGGELDNYKEARYRVHQGFVQLDDTWNPTDVVYRTEEEAEAATPNFEHCFYILDRATDMSPPEATIYFNRREHAEAERIKFERRVNG